MIKVDFTSGSKSRLRNLSNRFPRTMRAAFGAAAKRAWRRFMKVMQRAGGVYGVPKMPPHHQVSTYLRPGQKMGGVLSEKWAIVRYKLDEDTQYVGWPDKLAAWAEKFQLPDTHPIEDWRRREWHRRGMPEVPKTYVRPGRDVVESFAANLANDWPDMVLAMFDKYYNSRMAKYGSVT